MKALSTSAVDSNLVIVLPIQFHVLHEALLKFHFVSSFLQIRVLISVEVFKPL
jgi:hypothetical protein